MIRRQLLQGVPLLLPALLLFRPARAAAQNAGKPHRVAMQVDSNDPALMNLALNNVSNIARYYADRGEAVEIEVVTYGPGLHMLRADTSPIKDRIKSLAAATPSLHFMACANTRAGMAKAEGKEIPLIPEATVVPSGAVHLVARQEEGWSYLRP